MTSLSGTKIILPRSVVIYDRESIINQHIKFWLKWNIFVRRCQDVPYRFFVCVPCKTIFGLFSVVWI